MSLLKFPAKIYFFLPLAIILLVIGMNSCSSKEPEKESNYVEDNGYVFLNTSKDVKYVGMENCQSCHKTSHSNFTHSEMGRSFEKLDSTNVIEDYPQKNPVYDPEKDFYYEMIRKNGKFFQREFKKDKNGKIIYERELEAQYAIGSGNNLRMYFYDENGMFYQLPLTWNSHKRNWDLSPGFREAGNLRFSRYATKKCIGCHNSYMNEAANAFDRFDKPYQIGIGCERCHGPGELHLKEMNTDGEREWPENHLTIVNPAKLSSKRQLSVCMQCHLQGKAWAHENEQEWFDFRPGELLSTNRSVYFPEKTAKEVIEVGDSPHRLMLSPCFKESNGELTCITCHNPHLSIKSFTMEHYNQKCLSCHPAEKLPMNNARHLHKKNDNCVPCHMNRTGTDNTLHGVSLTDHWIRTDANKTIIDWTSLKQPPDKGPLVTLVSELDDRSFKYNIRKGVGYLDYYLEIDRRKKYLDSAIYYLNKNPEELKKNAYANFTLGEVYMEIGNYEKAKSSFLNAIKINPEYSEAYFKLGKAYSLSNDNDNAIFYFRKAVELKPDEPPYLENLGTALSEKGNYYEAVEILKKAISIDKQNGKTFYTLGFIYAVNLSSPEQALDYFIEAAKLDPTINDIYLNLGNTYALLGEHEKAIEAYKKEIIFRPNSTSSYINAGRIYQILGRSNEARNSYKKALSINPDLEIAKELLKQL